MAKQVKKPINNLLDIHGHLTRSREVILEDAVKVARLTLPRLDPKGEDLTDIPNTHEGAMGVLSLSSFLLKGTMPKGINWFKLDLTEDAISSLQSILANEWPAVKELIDAIMKIRVRDVMRALFKRMVRSRSLRVYQRTIVEGNVGMFMPEKGRIQIWPLRSIGVERNDGDLSLMTIKMSKNLDPMIDKIESDIGKGQDSNTNIHLIAVDFINNQVWVQNGARGKPKKSTNLFPWQFWVVVPEIPDFEDWSRGYAFNYLKLIDQIDHAGASLSEAMAAAAWNLPVIDENSTMADRVDELAKWPSNKPIVGKIDAFQWANSGVKINDWNFVASIKQLWASDMASVFALGLKDRSSFQRAATSATEILEVAEELRTQTGSLLSAIDETMMQPMIRAELEFAEKRTPLITKIAEIIKEATGSELKVDLEDLVDIEIITGSATAEMQEGLSRLITNVFPAIQLLDTSFRINGNEVAKAFMDTIAFPTEKMIMPPIVVQPQQPAGGVPGEDQPLPNQPIQTPGGPQNPGQQQVVQPGPPQR